MSLGLDGLTIHQLEPDRMQRWNVISCVGFITMNVKISVMASQITSLMIVYSTVYSGADHKKHQSSPSLAFVWGIHRWPVNSQHQGPVTQKMFPFDDVIMCSIINETMSLLNATKTDETYIRWKSYCFDRKILQRKRDCTQKSLWVRISVPFMECCNCIHIKIWM